MTFSDEAVSCRSRRTNQTALAHTRYPGDIAALQSPGASSRASRTSTAVRSIRGFVGLDRTSYAPDGMTATVPGEWYFGWVLDGRAVQDVWSLSPAGSATNPSPHWRMGERHTVRRAHRCLASHLGRPGFGCDVQLHRQPRRDEIVLRGHDEDGNPMRWIFSDISADAFRWRSEVSADGGATWRRTIEMRPTSARLATQQPTPQGQPRCRYRVARPGVGAGGSFSACKVGLAWLPWPPARPPGRHRTPVCLELGAEPVSQVGSS